MKVDRPIQSRYSVGQYLNDDDDVKIFHDLLNDLKYINTRGNDPITKEKFEVLKFFAEDDAWTALIPTNEAMTNAIAEGIIPDVTVNGWDDDLTAEELNSIKDWIDYHFIKGTVIFDDGMESGNFNTHLSYPSDDGKTTLYTQINIINDPNNLSILDATGQEVIVDHAKANILVKLGVVHKLDSVLKLKE